MESRVLGARNLIVSHNDLGVECEPFPRALLQGRNGGEKSCQGSPLPRPHNSMHAGSSPKQSPLQAGMGKALSPLKDSLGGGYTSLRVWWGDGCAWLPTSLD